tara:strand:- start:7548 stop:8720 length:1173 start_codon:yes stop_codon:yes gene_type:complete
MEIIGSGTYGCVYFPGFNCKGKKQKKNNKLVSKITTDEIGVQSEYEIGQTIKKNIQNYNDFFLIVEKKCSIFKGSLNDYVKKSCHLVEENQKKYHVLYSNFIKGFDLLDFYKTNLTKQDNLNNYYSNFFIYYTNLIQGVLFLENVNIVHFDLSLKNIRINQENNKAIIIDFGMSILINNLIKNQDLYGNVTDFDPHLLKIYFSINPITSPKYCFEIQTLCYIVLNFNGNYDKVFDNENFSKLIKNYYLKNQLFILFSEEFKDFYIENIYNLYSPFVGKPVKKIICQCLSSWRTWDSFNLHFHFISLLYNLDKFNVFLLEIINLSMRQIHSDPSKRLSCSKLIDTYKKILKNNSNHQILHYKELIQNMNYNKVSQSFFTSFEYLHSYQPKK